jgi:hypothetical protein
MPELRFVTCSNFQDSIVKYDTMSDFFSTNCAVFSQGVHHFTVLLFTQRNQMSKIPVSRENRYILQ